MSEPVAYLATNPTYPLNSSQIVREPQDWHITWEFKPLYLHPDPRVAELEAVLVECREVFAEHCAAYLGHEQNVKEVIAKIDEVLKK